MTSEHSSLEKYTSHTLFEMVREVLCVKGELETEQAATYWPPVLFFLFYQHFFLVLLDCSIRCPEGPKPSAGSLFSLQHLISKQLTPTNWTSCRTGLYYCLTPTCFLWASHLRPIQPVHSQGYTLISSTGCTCSSIDGWAEGQYVTVFVLRIITWNYNCLRPPAFHHENYPS